MSTTTRRIWPGRRATAQRLAHIMNSHPIYYVAMAYLAVIALVVAIVGAQNLLSANAARTALNGTSGTPVGSPGAHDASKSPIAAENAAMGTYDWLIAPSHTATTQIQAYASAAAVQPGHHLTFYVSVQNDGTPYTINVYRLGWYGRAGARLVYTSSQVGKAQGFYNNRKHILVSCSSCQIDAKTHLIDANWNPSFDLTIPSSWLTGIYEAKFTDADTVQTYLTFAVEGNPQSTYLAVTADTTEAAYNQWGGYSLYAGPDGNFSDRAYKVSLNRPVAGVGTSQGLNYEIDVVRWLERNGYDVSYTSIVDIHEHPEQLLQHRAILFLGHSEYWSAAMRDGAVKARDAGVGLAFLGADDAAWQIRFEAAQDKSPDRTIVCYKAAALDPLKGADKAHVTVNWRNAPISQPENALMGIMYSSLTKGPLGFPWYLGNNVSSSLLTGTGLQPGQGYGCDIVGYEWDRIFNNGATPAGLVVLGTSPTRSYLDSEESSGSTQTGAVGGDTSNTTYYITGSGAMVFAAGTIFWGYALDSFRLIPHAECEGNTAPVPGLQKLMANVMAALIVKQSH